LHPPGFHARENLAFATTGLQENYRVVRDHFHPHTFELFNDVVILELHVDDVARGI
jgi:hypothetical protein